MSLSLNRVKQENGVFIKRYGPKTPLWRYYIRSILDFIGIEQPVEYYNKRKRLAFEKQTLLLWRSYDLNVPNVLDQKGLELYLSIINGKTLAERFNTCMDMGIVAQVFDDLNYRHGLAFKYDEPRLCHIDANLRNIIYSGHRIFHVDFEMGREYEPASLWAEREVSKLLVSMLKNLTDEKRENVIRIFLQKYQFDGVVNALIAGKSKKKCKNKVEYSLCHLVWDLGKCQADED